MSKHFFSIKILLVLSGIVMLSTCAAIPEEVEEQQQSISLYESRNEQIEVKNGLIFIRRKNDNQWIEMVVNTDAENLDFEMALTPLDAPKSERVEVSAQDQQVSSRHFLSAQSYFLEGQYGRALREIKQSVKIDPNAALAWALKGSIHYKRKENGLARAAWEKALELDPETEGVAEMLVHISSQQ